MCITKSWDVEVVTGTVINNNLGGEIILGNVGSGDPQLMLQSISSRKLHTCCQADFGCMPRNQGNNWASFVSRPSTFMLNITSPIKWSSN